MTTSALNLWANFFFHEKLDPKQMTEKDVLTLMQLCSALAEKQTPYQGKGGSHAATLAARRIAVTTAFDLGIDLTAIKKRGYKGGKKVAMGRGLLDMWNAEYIKRFGGIHGTPGKAEVIRRTIVTKMSKDE